VDEDLVRLREAIDEVDHELLRLLNQRMSMVRQIGRIKADKGISLYDPGREESIFQRLIGANTGPLSNESLRSIYREIMAASRLLQAPLHVAFLGPEWTYSNLAAVSMFGHSARYLSFPSLEEVFDALLKRKAQAAVVPVENSLQGGVGRTLDLLYEREVTVVQECFLEVAHYLCGTGEDLRDLRQLYAHPQAMEQCRRWLLENLRNVETYECASTAQAAQLARKNPSGAAICNLYAARHYGLNILAERIEDHAGNTTRFLALSDHANPPTGEDKTSILFAVPDQPGALHASLEAFARYRVNLSRIESRPNRLFSWQYTFFADLEGHREDENLQNALGDLKDRVTFLKVLGSYPKSDPKHPIRPEKEKMRSVRFGMS